MATIYNEIVVLNANVYPTTEISSRNHRRATYTVCYFNYLEGSVLIWLLIKKWLK